MSDMNSVPADDPLARQLIRLAPHVDMGASRAAFDAARRSGGSTGNGDGPRWWLAAAVVLLVVTGVVGVWAIRGNDPADVPAVSTDPPSAATEAPQPAPTDDSNGDESPTAEPPSTLSTTVPPTTTFDREGIEHLPDAVPGSDWIVTSRTGRVLEITFLGHPPLAAGELCTTQYNAVAEETDEIVTIHLSAAVLTRVGNAIVSCAVPDTPSAVLVELDAPVGDRRLQSGDGTELTILPATAQVDPTDVLTSPPADPIEFLAIGDSVMLGAAVELNSRGYIVDALVSRQLGDVVAQVRALVQRGLLGDTPIVIHLGSNGAIAEADLDALLGVLAGYRNVVLLNNHADRAWIDRNNDLIQNADLRPNVIVIDWNDRARRCGDDCFAADGVHLNATGVEFYADMIREVVGR